MCVVWRAALLISFIVSEDSRGSARVSNEQIFSMTSSIYVEQPQHPDERNHSVIRVTHLDLEVFAEPEVVGYAIETYTGQGFNGCAAPRNLTTDL